MEYDTLSNGLRLPKVGYGTYKTEGKEGIRVVTQALEAGYRLLDTASFYGNEEAVGEGIRRSGIPREELLLTSKAWRNEMGYENILAAFDRSCRRLGVEYLDLYLIHWPRVPYSDPDWKRHNAESWRALEELYRAGRVRAIGVSNFLPEHLDALLETAEVCPMVNQIEYHPGWNQPQVLDWCRAHGTLVEAWSPMGRRRVLEHPLVVELAEKYGLSPAQLCIRFALENGVQPLPKSSSPERMRENLDVFRVSLTAEDVCRLNAMEPAGWSELDPRRMGTE